LAYLTLSEKIFAKEISGPFRYDAKILEAQFSNILVEASENPAALLYNGRQDGCKVFVVTKRDKAHDSGAVLLKSYRISGTEVSCKLRARQLPHLPFSRPYVSASILTSVVWAITIHLKKHFVKLPAFGLLAK
jgi:hypothetical protein